MNGLDLTAAFTAIYNSLNMPAVLALAVIAFVLHRIGAVSARAATLIPLVIGALLGMLSAIGQAEEFQGGWIRGAQLTQAIVVGALLNGGGALLVGRGASVLLEKSGLWPTTPTAGQP